MPNLYFMGDVCKRCVMSCNKKLFLVDSSVGISLDEYGKERTQTLFVHAVGYVLVSRAEQAYQPCSRSFRSSTSKILLPIFSWNTFTNRKNKLYDKYIYHWFNSVCFASPLSHYEMLSSCFIIYRHLRSHKYISNNAQWGFFHEVVYLNNVKIWFLYQ